MVLLSMIAMIIMIHIMCAIVVIIIVISMCHYDCKLNDDHRIISIWIIIVPHCDVDWLVVWTPLKNMKVNWDDDIPNINGKIKFMFQKKY